MRPLLTRRRLILSAAATAAAGLTVGLARPGRGIADTARVGPPRKLLLVVARGGWDSTYALDPKPGIAGIDAPAGTVESIAGIDVLTDPSRPGVGEFFRAWGSTAAVIRGLEIRSVSHNAGAARLLTGTFSETNPDVGALLAATHGRDRAVPYLVLGRTAFSGPYAALSARAGSTNQLALLASADNPVWYVVEPQVAYAPNTAQAALIRERVLAQAATVRERRGAAGDANRARIDDFVQAIGRAERLQQSAGLGDTDFIRGFDPQVDTAIEALQTGLSQVVQVEFEDFDTHTNNAQQGPLHDQFFRGLQRTLDLLAAAPGEGTGSRLLDETLVVVVSELGRTPKLNDDGGKDHWPVTSAMVLGAGVAGGRMIGATDDLMQGVGTNPETGAVDPAALAIDHRSFAAGVLEAVGVDPSEPIGDGVPPLRAFRA
jgi:uncharacterized protein (DUF1501 family)